jgi:hippurate hydrolase
MSVIDRIVEYREEMTAWRRDLHAHPEIGFAEKRTSDFVAGKLEEFGIEVHRGLAKTGVVGTLRNGDGPSIGLRADLDALAFSESNAFAHKSTNPGATHACGHDGHMTMLLGAARHLADTRNFKGTIHFIFQPAEELLYGGRVMVEEGLFEKFPVDTVFGMHCWPDIPLGKFATLAGPHLASADKFEMIVKGKGGHGAFPHTCVDPIVVSSAVINALQTIASRNTNTLDALVVSVCQIHAGDIFNVIPAEVRLGGTVRTFRAEVQETIEPTMRRIAEGVCAAHGATMELDYQRLCPATVNDPAETEIALQAAAEIVGESNVDGNPMPCMGTEDFSHMLNAKPGCYMWVGIGPRDERRTLHSPTFDFPDEALPLGASYWVKLAEKKLA